MSEQITSEQMIAEQVTRETPMSDLLDRQLPKWPQMRVSGCPVTIDQAKEIIRRTDRFFTHGCGGHDKAFNRDLAIRIGMPYHYDLIDYADLTLPQIEDLEARQAAWIDAWGGIETICVPSDWISTSSFYGPSGWCAPDGRIHHANDIGRRPSISDVRDDWAKIAAAFPFLDLVATLMDREGCEAGGIPVATMLVRRGHVDLIPGDLHLHDRFPVGPAGKRASRLAWESVHVAPSQREHGPICKAWYDEWAQIGQAIQRGERIADRSADREEARS
jgi:hypothetical protein